MPSTRETISQRIKRILEEREITPTECARLAGIDQGNFSKKLSGKRRWTVADVERVANALQIDPGVLTSLLPHHGHDVITYPVVAEWETGGFDYQLISAEHPIGYRVFAVPKAHKMLEKIYGIKVKDDDHSLEPEFPAGSVIRVQSDTWEEIREGSRVIYCRTDGKGCIRRVVSFTNGFVQLESPDPHIPPLKVPKAHLKSMDRIIGVDY